MPSLPYGITPYFAAYPGSPTLRAETYRAVVARAARVAATARASAASCSSTATAATTRAATPPRSGAAEHDDAQALWHNWWNGPRTWEVVQSIDPDASHASWLENFPWTRLAGVEQPHERKPMADIATHARVSIPADVRELLGDGSLGGLYERPDDDVLRVWQAGVEEVRDLIERGWSRA